jgi:plastocyanin
MSRERTTWCAVVTAVAGALLAAPGAHAQAQVVAGPPSTFVVSEATIDQGGSVTFMNFDVLTHDVTARGRGPDGAPLFYSPFTPSGGSSTVGGTQYLASGDYPFLCSLHPEMQGTLRVTSAGTPAPRPGPGSPRPSRDTHPPSIRLKVLDIRIRRVGRRRALRVRVTTDEAATVQMTARAKRKRLATGTAKLSRAGSATVRLKLTKAGRRLVKRSRRLRVSLTGLVTDAAGNSDTLRVSKTLRR